MTYKTQALAKINNVSILIIDKDEKFVPVKPICEAIGVDYDGQLQKIKRNEILNSTTCIIKVVAADKKLRDMVCIPYEYVFGWLFTIQLDRVNPESKGIIKRYQIECHRALFNHFTEISDYLEKKQDQIEEQLKKEEEARRNFNEAKKVLTEERRKLNEIRKYSIGFNS